MPFDNRVDKGNIASLADSAKGLLSENDRWHEWVSVSQSFKVIDDWFVLIIQGLGRMDCELIYDDSHFCELPEEQKGSIEESFKLNGRFTQSYLWVLGLYELVRSLDQRCRENDKHLNQSFRDEINGLKRKIERLRIPLAKLEPSRLHPSDSPIAYPALHRQHGIAWQIAPDVFMSRRELSNDTLDLFVRIRDAFNF